MVYFRDRKQDYASKHFERWKELAAKVSTEQNSARLAQLANEMNIAVQRVDSHNPNGLGRIRASQLGFLDLFHHRLEAFPPSIAARLNVSASVRYTFLAIVPRG
jgi:hypothetical protein